MNFYDAFISYGRPDSKAFAINLNEKLTAAGLNVWFDQDDIPPAVDYQKQIDDGIENEAEYRFSTDKLLQEVKKESSYYEKHKILLVKAQKVSQHYPSFLLLYISVELRCFRWFSQHLDQI